MHALLVSVKPLTLSWTSLQSLSLSPGRRLWLRRARVLFAGVNRSCRLVEQVKVGVRAFSGSNEFDYHNNIEGSNAPTLLLHMPQRYFFTGKTNHLNIYIYRYLKDIYIHTHISCGVSQCTVQIVILRNLYLYFMWIFFSRLYCFKILLKSSCFENWKLTQSVQCALYMYVQCVETYIYMYNLYVQFV